MNLRRRACLLIAALASGAVSAQQIQTYTESVRSTTQRALGYPVPLPVASLTPVDGFRDYASLDARLRALDAASADLLGADVGSTRNNRPVRAYVVSDADGVDREGRPEAAFFINAATHAREWAAPEVSTFLVERMVEGGNDQGLVRYLLDNARLVIIPVQNVDGFLQTQRYPTQVVVGRDPRVPSDWPRDGRMRRKNMNGVDERLDTFADHLQGVDLNRNHPPFWGTTTQGGQLTNPDELTYRGGSAHSEPENQSILRAAELAPASRIRLGIDLHTFSRVFFSSNTSRSRLNQIQARLISVLSQHHLNVPTASGTANGKLYPDIPDPANSGIGAAAEYFAYQWLVPAWTLELEPSNGSGEYGGGNDSHGGFILPASQIRRVREAWAETHLVAFYFMAGPPHLQRVRLLDASSGNLLVEQSWSYDPQQQRRLRSERVLQPIVAGQRVRAELSFSKPMRYRSPAGVLGNLPGVNVATAPGVGLVRGEAVTALDTSAGSWLHESGFLRYRDDTFRFEFTAEAGDAAALRVTTTDMVGLPLDADPATPVDWSAGAWSEWEDVRGVDGDVGGSDSLTASLAVSSGLPAGVTLAAVPALAGEGDALRLTISRDPSASAAALVFEGQLQGQAAARLQFAAGEAGTRVLELPLAEDVLVQGERSAEWTLDRIDAEGASRNRVGAGQVQVLDNDRSEASVVRVRADIGAALRISAQSTQAVRELVLDGGRSYAGGALPEDACPQVQLQAGVALHGNRARLAPMPGGCSAIRVAGEGEVRISDLSVSGDPGDGSRAAGIEGADSGTRLRLARVDLHDMRQYAIHVAGSLDMQQSSVRAVDLQQQLGDQASAVIDVGGSLRLDSSTLLGNRSSDEFNLGNLVAAGSGQAPGELGSLSLLDSRMHGLLAGGLQVASSLQQQGFVAADKLSPMPPPCSGARSAGFNLFESSCLEDLQGSDRVGLDLAMGSAAGVDDNRVQPPAEAVDAGGTCSSVDQRGAPRPQTLAAGASARCDIGAVEQGVNPWRGFWIPSRSGHGIDLQTSGNVLFLLWYTYADDGQPVAYQAAAALTGPDWSADLLQTRLDGASGQPQSQRVGRIGIRFNSDTEAQLSWRFDARGIEGREAIRAYVFTGDEPRFEVTGTWFPPTEPGNGASIARRGEVTAAVLYYYDGGGTLRWALGTGDGADAAVIALDSYTGFCPDCDATTMPVQLRPAGQLRLHFLTPQRLSLTSDITYPGPAGGRWRRDNAAFVPISDAVDNRDAAAAAARR